MQEFELSTEVQDASLVVRLRGDLDIVTSRELDDTLSKARKTHQHVVLDLSGVEFMDTSSLAVIVGHWKGVTAAGGSLSLAGARYQYTKTLWITGLADRIPMFETVALAIEAQQKAPG